MAEKASDTALRVLHYAAPLAAVIYFACAKTAAAIYLQEPAKRAGTSLRRWGAAILQATILSTIIAQSITYIARAVQEPDWAASQDTVVYAFLEGVTYLALIIGIIETKTPLWHPFVGAWIVGLVADLACTVLLALVEDLDNVHANICLALQVLRSLALLLLCLSAAAAAFYDRHQSVKLDDESEALLADGANGAFGHAKPNGGPAAANGSLASLNVEEDEDHDDDLDFDEYSSEPDQDKELRVRQQKRLKDSGSWLNYLKDFKIFVPMLWPYKNRVVQGCLALVGVELILERFLSVLVPRQIGILTDRLTSVAGSGRMPWHELGVWMTFYVLSSIGPQFRRLIELPIQQFTYKQIGSSAFRHIMLLSMDFHNEKNSGELIRAVDQGQHLTGLLEFLCFESGPMFIDLAVAFVYVTTLFDIYMALILALVGLVYFYIGLKTTAWSVKARKAFNAAFLREGKCQNEAINNWQTVSQFNRGAYECNRYDESIDNFNAAELRYYLSFYAGSSMQSMVMLLGRLAGWSLAVYQVAQGRAPVGHFITLTMYWGSIESPLTQVSWSIRRLSSMLTDSERLLQLLLTKPSVVSQPDAPPIRVDAGEVQFDEVDFAYDPRKQILKGVSFKAKPGQTIALVGETGGGKSTILKLLYRYYDVVGGSIKIDGQDIRQVSLDSLRDSFGMVPQDPALFNISLMDNIKYARLDATDAEVFEACKAAAIHDKIESFPDKYKSTVGERGVKLSGGELQRVSISRAILRQPKIVLLDEATSMIDAETESLIQAALKRLTAGRTTFVIAHRLCKSSLRTLVCLPKR